MLLSAVSVLVATQSSSEIPDGLMNNPVDVLYYMGSAATVLVVKNKNAKESEIEDCFVRSGRGCVV